MAPITKTVKMLIRIMIPLVISIAILTFIIWNFKGVGTQDAITRAIAVILMGCPCALMLSVPAAVKIGKKIADANKLTYKNEVDMLEEGRVQILAMNKIGTITKGEYLVTDVFSADHITKSGYNAGVFDGDDELLETAHVLGSLNDHPMSKAILKHTSELYIQADDEIKDFKYYPGNGLEGEIEGVLVRGGNLRFVEEKAIIPP